MNSARAVTCFGRAAAVAAVMVLAGCPYSADQPLGDPASAVPDPALAGTWRSEDPESHEVISITFAGFNEHEMVGFSWEPGPGDKAILALRLFVTPIGGEKFLNVRELRDDAEWNFARYRIVGDTLTIRLIDDALFESKSFSSPEELTGFIAARLSDPRLYGRPDDETPDMVLTRFRQ
jgi:hypothetical protein